MATVQMVRTVLVLICVLIIGTPARAQTDTPPALAGLAGDYFPIDSVSTEGRYHIYVRYPEGYDPADERLYPTVYLLDGDSLFPMLAPTQLFLHYDEALPAHVVAHSLDKRAAFVAACCPPGSGLDVGCGTGVLAARLAARGYGMTGIDPSAGMLDVMAAEHPEVVKVRVEGLSKRVLRRRRRRQEGKRVGNCPGVSAASRRAPKPDGNDAP